MKLVVGQSWYSTTDSTVVMVIRPSEGEVALTCGGEPMAGAKPDVRLASGLPAEDALQIGKRYLVPGSSVELLCIHGGTQAVAIDGRVMEAAAPKPLPATD